MEHSVVRDGAKAHPDGCPGVSVPAAAILAQRQSDVCRSATAAWDAWAGVLQDAAALCQSAYRGADAGKWAAREPAGREPDVGRSKHSAQAGPELCTPDADRSVEQSFAARAFAGAPAAQDVRLFGCLAAARRAYWQLGSVLPGPPLAAEAPVVLAVEAQGPPSAAPAPEPYRSDAQA